MQAKDISQARNLITTRRSQFGAQLHARLLGPNSTFTSFLERSARDWPDRTALVYRTRVYTYRELFLEIWKTAWALRDFGIRPGGRVAVLLDNSDAYVVWYLAILGAGAVAVPINTKLVEREVSYILSDSESALIITEEKFSLVVTKALQSAGLTIGCLVIDAAPPKQDTGPAAPSAIEPGSINAPAAIYYTSGTTGAPKGVVHSHASLIAGCLQGPHAWEFDIDGLIALAITPLFHIASHTLFLPVLSIGGTLIVDSYGTDTALDLIERHCVNSFFGVPSILLMMVEKAATVGIRLPKVQVVQFGAAPMPAHKLSAVQQLFPNAALVHGMGQTESSGTLVTLPSTLAYEKAGSVGLSIPACEIRIVDEKGEELRPGQVGELTARGPNVMLKYLNNPKATAETLKDGWLHTGDLGYIDQDGFLFLVDRKKDMIIRGGENIYSSEVENILLTHPAVLQAAVVSAPNPLLGEEVCAFLVQKPGAPSVSDADIVTHCKPLLASYKVPSIIKFIDSMPMTATGKIQKGELRKRVQALR